MDSKQKRPFWVYLLATASLYIPVWLISSYSRNKHFLDSIQKAMEEQSITIDEMIRFKRMWRR